MSERPQDRTAEPASEAEALLPWYLTGQLSQAERAMVEEALGKEPALKAELARLEALQETVQETSAAVAPPPASDFDRLMSQIEAEERTQAIVQAQAREARGGWLAQLGALFSPPAVRAALAIALVAILLEGAVIANLATRENGYVTATGSKPETIAGPRLLVIFKADAAAGAITALVSELGGRIIDGPSAEGAFVIELPASAPMPETLDSLRAREDLVRFASEAS